MEADRRPPPPPLPDPPPADHRRGLIREELEETHRTNSKWKQTRLQSADKLARVNRTPSKRDMTHWSNSKQTRSDSSDWVRVALDWAHPGGPGLDENRGQEHKEPVGMRAISKQEEGK